MNNIKLIDNEYFDEVLIKVLHTNSTYDGEYETHCDIELLFRQDKILEVKIFDNTIELIGVRITNDWFGEEIELNYIYKESPYSDDIKTLNELSISKSIIKCIYYLIAEEETKENRGWLHHHSFSDCSIFEDNLELRCCEDCNHCDENIVVCRCKESKFYDKEIKYRVACDKFLEID